MPDAAAGPAVSPNAATPPSAPPAPRPALPAGGPSPPAAVPPAGALARANVHRAVRSGVHGYGLFAVERIPSGYVWWAMDEGRVLRVGQTQHGLVVWAAELSPSRYQKLLDALHIYGYYEADSDKFIFCLDDARYVNHSPSPNSAGAADVYGSYEALGLVHGETASVAATDIPEGAEIFEDYFSFDQSPWCSALACEMAAQSAKCRPTGARPSPGSHEVFHLNPRQYATLMASTLPDDSPGRYLFDYAVPDGAGGASIIVEIP
ncbi:hypothetical protein DFJ74DRAFT_700522 [Hyaloraphidium curvatum]|nr:hypothetical protein DFJ74DRAFT_700522 [Hyaloraphidium curvatum]